MDATRLALARMKSELRAKRVSDIPQPKAVTITVQVGGEEPGEEAELELEREEDSAD